MNHAPEVDIAPATACDAQMPVLRALAFLFVLSAVACTSTPRALASNADELALRAIVQDVYAIVSGDKGQPRDWDRLRKHFVEGGTMHVSMQRGERIAAAKFDVEQFIAMANQNSQQQAFYEAPLVTRVEAFSGVGHAWSSYTARSQKDGDPFARGVNCFTFVKTKDGWRIATIAWSEETDTVKLPAELLPRGD